MTRMEVVSVRQEGITSRSIVSLSAAVTFNKRSLRHENLNVLFQCFGPVAVIEEKNSAAYKSFSFTYAASSRIRLASDVSMEKKTLCGTSLANSLMQLADKNQDFYWSFSALHATGCSGGNQGLSGSHGAQFVK
nr:hypothetical protein [Escherichia coli]